MEVRASNAERERTVTVLREHAADGRLTYDELSERVEQALVATSRADLLKLVADLPDMALEPAETATLHRPRRARRWFVNVIGDTRTRRRWRAASQMTGINVI